MQANIDSMTMWMLSCQSKAHPMLSGKSAVNIDPPGILTVTLAVHWLDTPVIIFTAYASTWAKIFIYDFSQIARLECMCTQMLFANRTRTRKCTMSLQQRTPRRCSCCVSYHPLPSASPFVASFSTTLIIVSISFTSRIVSHKSSWRPAGVVANCST